MGFLDENYLLETDTAKNLYSQVENLPILDAHNHGDVEEIILNEGWSDIWEVEGATDHYVWEMMRRRGIKEEKITGSASNREKWLSLAKIFPELAGNPTFEWIHLDLKRRFGIEKEISEQTAEYIWGKTQKLLQSEKMTPQNLLQEMKVEVMCTTDNPDSLLIFHKKAQQELSEIKILPTWRPDRAMNIGHIDWNDFVDKLGAAYDEEITNFNQFKNILEKSHDFFDEMGCTASDHGVKEPSVYPVSRDRVSEIFNSRRNKKELSDKEISDFKSYMMMFFGELNEKTDWVTQLHIGAVRDYRDHLYDLLGPDSGGDVATNALEIVDNMRYFFNKFDGSIPVVLYYLDPVLAPAAATIARAFPNISLGAPWWFIDSHHGIEQQLKFVATVDLLSNHAGMVTDSRKLMSYDSRTEVFRRTACNVLGEMVEKGQIPFEAASDLAYRLSYKNPYELYFKDSV